jgi:hypothetical protein
MIKMNERNVIILEGKEEELKEIMEILKNKKITHIKHNEELFLETLTNKLEEVENRFNQPILRNEKFLADIIFYGTEIEKISKDAQFVYSIYSDGYVNARYEIEGNDNELPNENLFMLPTAKYGAEDKQSICEMLDWNELTLHSKSLRNGNDYVVTETYKLNKIKTLGMGN